MSRQAVSVDDVLTAIETARDKLMANEVKQLVREGLPRVLAVKMVNDRYRQRDGEEGGEAEHGSGWPDIV